MSFRLDVIRNLTKRRAEKFFRKLAGMTDLEDALKKLDRLTQEEARMANAEVLRIAHSIRDEVKIVDGKVERVDDKVDSVGNKVEDVGGKVEDVGGKVEGVDEKVQVVIDGARSLSSQLQGFLTYMLSDGKQAAKEIGVKIEDVGGKVQSVDDRVQVVIDGTRGLSSKLLCLSHIYTLRRQTRSEGNRCQDRGCGRQSPMC